MRYRTVYCLLFLLVSFSLLAQSMPGELLDFNQASIAHQRSAMLTLGGWAVINIGTGLALRGGTSGGAREFHTMNALWNTVNLGIAGFGYWSAARSNPAGWDLAQSLNEHQNFQQILLFNAGLDVGYIMGGLYLTERAKRPGANADRLRGFGKSIMLQGGFLMLFDLANYFIAMSRDDRIELLLGPTQYGLGLSWTF